VAQLMVEEPGDLLEVEGDDIVGICPTSLIVIPY
jgi:hypothetical protein